MRIQAFETKVIINTGHMYMYNAIANLSLKTVADNVQRNCGFYNEG